MVCDKPPSADPLVLARPKVRNIKDAEGVVWVAWDARGYQQWSKILNDLLAHIEQRKAVEAYYRKCIADHNAGVRDQESSIGESE